MIDFFSANFSEFLWLAVILIAMIPGLEGRIALPFALSMTNLSIPIAFICSFFGSIIPFFVVFLITRLVKHKTEGFLYDRMITLINGKYKKRLRDMNKGNNLRKCILLCGFVALPLPLTGVWSGSILAGFSDLSLWQSFVSISIGSLISCSIILGISSMFQNSTIYLLLISIAILLVYIFVEIILSIIKKRRG